MLRRTLSVALLVVIAVQLVGPMAFAAVCFEPCPDDTKDSSCSPVCSLCTSCTHSRQAIVPSNIDSVAFVRTLHAFPPQVFAASSALAADIFHVPLLG